MSIIKGMIDAAARARKVLLDHFTYTATFQALGVGVTAQVAIPISADSDFLWMETSLVDFVNANNINPAPDLLVSFTDTGSGRNLQDNPVHVINITGNGQWPYVLPEPKLLIGNGSLQVTIQNLTGVQQGRIDVALIGVKVFYIKDYNRSQLIQGL